MALGPGKYDDLCSEVRLKADAQGVVVIIFSGNKGSGFSCQLDIAHTLALPEILENIAKQIREPDGDLA